MWSDLGVEKMEEPSGDNMSGGSQDGADSATNEDETCTDCRTEKKRTIVVVRTQ